MVSMVYKPTGNFRKKYESFHETTIGEMGGQNLDCFTPGILHQWLQKSIYNFVGNFDVNNFMFASPSLFCTQF
jgi:hypothetical protein